jgi:hypothetical protein
VCFLAIHTSTYLEYLLVLVHIVREPLRGEVFMSEGAMSVQSKGRRGGEERRGEESKGSRVRKRRDASLALPSSLS